MSLYAYELIDWWLCHHGSILPLHGRGKVIYEHVLGDSHYIEGGRGVLYFGCVCVETLVPTSLASYT